MLLEMGERRLNLRLTRARGLWRVHGGGDGDEGDALDTRDSKGL
jgi:hypothetical protein